MANINSLTSNSYGNSYNLYGNRNVLTGLASGMDTESMIQNSISGYLMKIQSLQQSQTKIQWKQDAYRSIIDKMNSIVQKYTSYTSKTNLASNAFFTRAVKTETLGKHASAISATGSTKSDIKINSVDRLATATRYSVDTSALDVNTSSEAVGKAINWSETKQFGQVKGSIQLTYNGNEKIYLDFDESDVDITDAGKLAEAIEKKLSETEITVDGKKVKASDLIEVKRDGQKFTFAPKEGGIAGAGVYISRVSGNVADTLGAQNPESSEIDKAMQNDSFTVPGEMSELVKTQSMAEYLSGKTVEITLDGVKKTIKIGDLESKIGKLDTSDLDQKRDELLELFKEEPGADGTFSNGKTRAEIEEELEALDQQKGQRSVEYSKKAMEALRADLEESAAKAFGTGKVNVSIQDGGLRFDPAEGSGSTLSVESSVGEALGIDKGVANYFNTSNTLKTILGEDWLKEHRVKAELDSVRGDGADMKFYDADGNLLTKVEELDENGEKVTNYYRVNDEGKFVYSVEINGKSIGQFTEDTALESVITAINSDADSGVKVSYSNLTSQFVFTANETGEGGKISFDNDLAQKLFMHRDSTGDLTEDARIAEASGDKSVSYTQGEDAVVKATVNGKEIELKRSSNVINMDGLTVTLNDTFEADGEAITFKTSSDSDVVVDTIKSFVEDINELMQSIHDAYATMPLKKSSSSKSSTGYEPLTDEDKKDMSESAITAYEEKAKTGLLFGDNDLSQLYSRLLSAIQTSGTDRMDMEAIGLTTTYSDGVTKLALDEDKLRAALEGDPDKVRNVFAKTVEGGAKTNGLIASVKTTLNNYGSTSLASVGILVSKAGTKLSAISLMNNNLQKEYDNLEKQIEQWQSRMSDKVDYYTRQFTQLEMLMNTMNNQSSMLAGLMGGY